MTKIDKHIEIVRSSTVGLISMGKKSADAIALVLAKSYSNVGVTVVDCIADLDALIASGPDLVFIGMKFLPENPRLGLQDANKVWIADYLEEYGIAYTGSKFTAHELEYNKPLAKQHIVNAGLNTSSFTVIKQDQTAAAGNVLLDYPVFIKPTNRGGGQGIDCDSVAYSLEEVQLKVRSIADNLQADSLLEEFLPGREFSVAILRDQDNYLVLPIEKVPPLDDRGKRILSQKIKKANSVIDLLVTDPMLGAELTTLALKSFHALGARDYGRIDLRLDQSGTPQFLEANLIPSLIDGYGSFPKSCMLNMNISHEAMILRIVELGLARSGDTDEDATEPLTSIYNSLLAAA